MTLPLSRQLLYFLLAGLVQILLDSSVFMMLTAAGASIPIGNVAGRIAGACLGFWLNGRYTFASADKPLLGWTQWGRFVLAWLALTAISTVVLSSISAQTTLASAWLAKPLVEAAMAGISFLIWRHWVYR